jgi:TonB family protein
MDKRWWAGLMMAVCATVAIARDRAGTSAVLKQAEASMLVAGSLTIATDGSVSGYALDHREKLPPGVVALVEQALPKWRFEPVQTNGVAHEASAAMSLLVVANKVDGDRFTVRIRSAQFRETPRQSSDSVSSKSMPPPQYPLDAFFSGVRGTVYLVVRIDRDGRVADASVEQVNLRVLDSEAQMRHWREVLAAPALKAAKRWRFNPPTTGKHVGDAFWSARVPVDYRFEGETSPKYGGWSPYIPGPRQTISWLNKFGEDTASSPEALASGGIYPVGEGLRLLTPLEAG